ncbi:MAG TPA: hypothetical protein VGL99_32155 [Chloroflexota bacterium]|jgi:hypothetical protein
MVRAKDIMPRILSILASAAFALTVSLSTLPIAGASAEEAPSSDFAIAQLRPAGEFEYGTHVAAVHAPMARAAGFKLMWGYVPWQQVEPTRGDFVFRKQDQWGKPQPNALTNVISAAADAGMKVILRIDEVPGWAGGNPAQLDPTDLESYL